MSMRRILSTPGITIAVLVCVGLGAWGIFGIGSGGSGGQVFSGELYKVVKGSFDITVPTSGELAAEKRVNIHNHLESGATIIELVAEGARVQVGDVLLRLNDEEIRDNIRNSELSVTDASNVLQSARSSLSISEKKRDSELAVKQLAVDLATLALMAWQEGELVGTRLSHALAIQTAEKNYQRLLKKYESSLRLYEKKFLSKDELDQDEIALLNAEATLKKAKLGSTIYENYNLLIEKQQKESGLQQAKDELERATARLELELKSSKANVDAKENKLQSHQENLKKQREQLDMCVVLSPASGMVVYATSVGRRREDSEPLNVGQTLHRNQLLLTIPDTSNMIARVKVNEALSGLVSAGQPATVVCDALPERLFHGEVLSVGVLAEGGGWRDPNRRDYTVEIKLSETENAPLKPSMRCSADVYVKTIREVLFVPIHAVHRDGSVVWVWLQKEGGFTQQVVEMGSFSNSYAAINSGLDVGSVVLLREPEPSRIVGRLPRENEE